MRHVRYVLYGIGAAAVLLTLAVVATAVAYSPTYAVRYLVWQDADVGDHARFPSRTMEPAPAPHRFPTAGTAAAEAVVTAFDAADAVGGDLDAFLDETRTQALIVLRDGEVILERYVGDFERDSIATSFSVAKSFLSALVGIAIEEGAIGTIEDPITDYLPELLERDRRFADITVAHLLNMSSGIHYVETGLPNGDDALTYYFDDLEALALERTTIDGPPGQAWLYNNYHPLLLGIILERTTGMSVTAYLESRIWQPMGAEFEGSWSLDADGGLEKLESGINGRPIDFAKLGQLYLDDGVGPDGSRVVPAAWVEGSTSPSEPSDRDGYYPPHMDQPFGSVSHGLFWWRIERPSGETAFTAVGNHGQFVFVDPARRIVIVRHGETYGRPMMEWLGLFLDVASSLGR
ncbi:MAG TPA: serine hydrolase [Candidatus Angelobacter sp.]|nr:serine hydrolase [Candidatus Angelobacter sp.]